MDDNQSEPIVCELTVWDRLFRFLENGMFLTLLGLVGGFAGTFLDGRYFALLSLMIPAAIHRSKALEGLDSLRSTLSFITSIVIAFGLFWWLGVNLNSSRPATFTPSDYARAVSKVLKPDTTISTTEIIEPPGNIVTPHLAGKAPATASAAPSPDPSLPSSQPIQVAPSYGNLAMRADALSDKIMADLDMRGWRHYKEDPVPPKWGQYMPTGNGPDRQNWNDAVYDYFRFSSLGQAVAIRNEFAALHIVDSYLDSDLKSDYDNVLQLPDGQMGVTLHRMGNMPGMLPVTIESVAMRLRVISTQLPKQQ